MAFRMQKLRSLAVRLASASLAYFAIVFSAGFFFGTIRVFGLEPRLGKTLAVACEAPFMLAVMIWAARRVPTRMGLSTDRGPLLGMGILALVFQQIADVFVGVAVRGLSPAQQIQHFATSEGAIYAVLLVLFAVMPLLSRRSSAA